MALPPPPTKVEQATKTRKTTRKPSISPESGKSRNSETKRTNLEKKGDSNKSRPGQVVSFQGSPPPERVQSVRDPADRRRPSGSCREGHKRGSGSRGWKPRSKSCLSASLLCRGDTDGQLRSHGVWGRGRQHGDGDAGEKGTGCGRTARTVGFQLPPLPPAPAEKTDCRHMDNHLSSPDSRPHLPPTSGDSPARVQLDFSCLPVCFQCRHGREKTQSQGRARAPRAPPPPPRMERGRPRDSRPMS